MKIFTLLFFLFLMNLGFVSCEKEKKPENPINGTYKYKSLHINDLDNTNMLINDTIILKNISLSGTEGSSFLVLYFDLNGEKEFRYTSNYILLNSSIKVNYISWELAPESFVEHNIAIAPFSKQDVVFLDYSKPTEEILSLSTVLFDKKYNYEFEKI